MSRHRIAPPDDQADRIEDRVGHLPRVLLLNPPGGEIYIRDYYCSKVSKTTYVYTPVDLLVQSARLRGRAEMAVVDAIGERLPAAEVFARIRAFAPDAIVMLTAAVSWKIDLAFLKELRGFYKGRVVGSGDVLMDNPKDMLARFTELDAILTDFTTDELPAWLAGGRGPYRALVARGLEMQPPPASTGGGYYDLPIPRHDLFPHERYRYPFVRRLPFATVLTDFGCAFKCTFCIQSFLDFKMRSAENVLQELRYLKRQGFRELYFSDQTFAYNPARARQLFRAMIDEKMDFGWVAFFRVDLVKEDMLALMKKAGCHTLMFGIESANEARLAGYKKNLKLDQIRKGLALCRAAGVRTVGTFILGFPNDTRRDIEATIDFSLELPLDYVSYNLPVPRSRTALREEAVAEHIVGPDPLVMDQSGKHITMGSKHVSAEELFALRNYAIKRFYLRPIYLFSRLFGIRGWTELKINILDGYTLLREACRRQL